MGSANEPSAATIERRSPPPQPSNKTSKALSHGLYSVNENTETDKFEGVAMKFHKKLTVNDFEFLKVVGKGSFGKVMMVRKRDEQQIYAMKVLKKKALVKRKQVVHTQTERRVLSCIDNPFIVSLRYAFQSEAKLYMVLDFFNGGELFFHLKKFQSEAKLYMVLDFFNGGELFFHLKKDGRFAESRARFYSAEICLALECLHLRGIIYRDLKPENILLDSDGHIKVTDFGLSKECIKNDSVTHTFCGTPEYLAPEVLQQQGHGKAVDWWSFGTLLYEMLTGLPPFYSENLSVMYEKILHSAMPMPKYLSKEARSIFLGLLDRDPKRRLGSSRKDASEIKEHAFFEAIDWCKLLAKEVEPPYKPKVVSKVDTSNIDEEFVQEMPTDTPVSYTGSMLAAKDAFVGFTFDEYKHNGSTLL
eukprot:CAMPEP_0202730154 /NCGR_PEP_ID=MMETSP1385-20130828/186496_1 /ASSEMBLY_ACC=CAM_ASM_000861 /TAXON_ID=933848 /ORGANISM="Elphidium margaritaceum" /LENGTH=416 /DNA_ID=CAMNT_0049396427 /DNA_START=540 /DNA_END=1791 /DNA_ORIENTATION=-